MESGDIVYLKSGSPALTVEDVDFDSQVTVSWYYIGELRKASFPSACLTFDAPVGTLVMQ